MNTTLLIILIGLATIASTFLGGLFAIRLKDKLHLILGFSAGTVLAVALFDLLPEALNLGGNNLNLITLFVAAGFIIYMVFDRFFSLHAHNEEETCQNPDHRGRLGAVTLSIHSFLDGLAIGLAFKVSPAVGWILAIAVLTHDFSDGVNTANMILRNHGSKAEALKWLVMDAIAPFLGILVAFFITVNVQVLGLILAVFTGFFLYLGASDLIPESHHHHPTLWTTISTILGFLVLYGAIRLIG